MKKIIIYILSVILIILIAVFFILRSGILYPQVTLYFFKTYNHQAVLVVTQRKCDYLLNTKGKLQYAIEELLKGPDIKEKKLDFFSFIPSGSILSDIKINNGIAYLDFNEKIESGGGTENMQGRLSQIVFTATQFPQVKKIRFLINGKEITSFSGEGLTDVDKPLGRNNMKKILP